MTPAEPEVRLEMSTQLDLADLESKLKVPGSAFSLQRFLGNDEDILDVITNDRIVLKNSGLTHDDVADAIDGLFKKGEEEG